MQEAYNVHTLMWKKRKNKLFASKGNSFSSGDSVEANFSSLSELTPHHKRSPFQGGVYGLEASVYSRHQERTSLGLMSPSAVVSHSDGSEPQFLSFYLCSRWNPVSVLTWARTGGGSREARLTEIPNSESPGVWLGLEGPCIPVQGPDWQVTSQSSQGPSVSSLYGGSGKLGHPFYTTQEMSMMGGTVICHLLSV